MIRAPAIKQKDIGDDALVEHVRSTVAEGIDATRLILVTGDKGLIRRMPLGVKWRSPTWLTCEMVNFLADKELGHAPVPVPSPVGEASKTEANARESLNQPAAERTSPDRGRSWTDWWGSLVSLPALFSSFAGSGGTKQRTKVARTGPRESS